MQTTGHAGGTWCLFALATVVIRGTIAVIALAAACAPTGISTKPATPPGNTAVVDHGNPEARVGDTTTGDRDKPIADDNKLAVRIRDRATKLGIRVTKVSCPDVVAARAGVKFSCQIEIEGKKAYTMDATVRDADGPHGLAHFDITWHDGVAVRVAALESAYREELSKPLGIAVSVACGDEPLRFLDAQRKLRCDVAAGDATATLTIEFDAHVAPASWKLEPALVVPSMTAKLMTPIVRAKTNPRVELDCGPKIAFARPTDGIIWCTLTDGTKQAKLRIEIDDKLDMQRWAIVPAS